jgi:GDPmannose 4,6-dehydratase
MKVYLTMAYFLLVLFIPFSISCQTAGKKALIFGVTGQDGHYLTELLLSKNYVVHGVERPISTSRPRRKFTSSENFHLHHGDLLDSLNVAQLIQQIQPDEIYNLGAQSHVKISFDCPEYTANVDGLGTLRILEAIRLLGLEKRTKFYQASTSEMFGMVAESPQSESTPFNPRSPYAIAKVFAYWITKNYRDAYGMYACNGILFNHESPFRGEKFVTRKITKAACRYKLGKNEVLYLGNLDAKRDWGYTKDYVEAMWLMLQQPEPDDFVIASGENHSVREFLELAYKAVDVEIDWLGAGEGEYGVDRSTGQVIVRIDPQLYRPTEVDTLLGDCSKARKILRWQPKVNFNELLKIMVEADYQAELKACAE